MQIKFQTFDLPNGHLNTLGKVLFFNIAGGGLPMESSTKSVQHWWRHLLRGRKRELIYLFSSSIPSHTAEKTNKGVPRGHALALQ